MSDESDKSPPTKKRRVMASERPSIADTSGDPSTLGTAIEKDLSETKEKLRECEDEIRKVNSWISELEEKDHLSEREQSRLKCLIEKEKQLREEKKLLLEIESQLTKLLVISEQRRLQREISDTSAAELPPIKKFSEQREQKVEEERRESWERAIEDVPVVDANPVETPSLKELLTKFEQMENKLTQDNTLLVLGPKGCGKTTSLLYMRKKLLDKGYKVAYFDFGVRTTDKMNDLIADSIKFSCTVVLLDNVQLFDKNVPISRIPYVIAAFSPGSLAKRNIRVFEKARYDGRSSTVYFRPLDSEQSQQLLQSHGISVKRPDTAQSHGMSVEPPDPALELGSLASPSASSVSSEITISESEFCDVYFNTSGIPRYLVEYCEMKSIDESKKKDKSKSELEKMNETKFELPKMKELFKQYHELKDELSVDEIFKRIVEIESSHITYEQHDLILRGIACVNEEGRVCITHPDYIIFNLEDKKVFDHQNNWTRLEQLVLYRIQFSQCCVVNCMNAKIDLPKPTVKDILIQKEIGEWPNVDHRKDCYLVKLAPNHPVIDAVLVDDRDQKPVAYFIQISFSRYSNHKKKVEHLENTKLRNEDSENSLTVVQFFEEKLKYESHYYVYATTEYSVKPRNNAVYLFDARNQFLQVHRK